MKSKVGLTERRPKHRAEMTADSHPRPLFDRIELAHYLEGKGLTGPRLTHVIVAFSRAVAEAYVLAHGERPPKVAVWIPDVGARSVFFYQGPGDRQLIEDVFHSLFTPELELRDVS